MGSGLEPPRRKAFFVAPDHCWIGKVAFSPEGRYLAVGMPDGAVYLFRLTPCGTVAEFPARNSSWVLERQLEGHGHQFIHTVMVSADGREGLAGEGSDVGIDQKIRRWDLTSGKQLAVYQGHLSSIWKCGFAADGRCVVVGGKDGRVRVWNFVDQSEVWVREGHTNWVASAAMSANGRVVLSGSHDLTARLWDGRTGEPGEGPHRGAHRPDPIGMPFRGRPPGPHRGRRSQGLPLGRPNRRKAAPFSEGAGGQLSSLLAPDGKRAAWVGENGLVRVWDLDELRAAAAAVQRRRS